VATPSISVIRLWRRIHPPGDPPKQELLVIRSGLLAESLQVLQRDIAGPSPLKSTTTTDPGADPTPNGLSGASLNLPDPLPSSTCHAVLGPIYDGEVRRRADSDRHRVHLLLGRRHDRLARVLAPNQPNTRNALNLFPFVAETQRALFAASATDHVKICL
jgi:hypothetical protein